MSFSSSEDPISSLALGFPKSSIKFGEHTGSQAEGVFEIIYNYYRPRLYVYITRIVGNDEVGHDLTQDTLLSAWRMLGNLKKAASLESWLYTIATNKARDHLRKKKLVFWLPWSEEQEESCISEHFRTEGFEEHVAQAELVQRVLIQLSFEERACLLLFHAENFSQKEIAEAINVSERGVRRHLKRAEEQFVSIYHDLCKQQEEEETR